MRRQRDIRKRTGVERKILYFRDRIRKLNGAQLPGSAECAFPDAEQTVRQNGLRQLCAVGKGILPDGSHARLYDDLRNVSPLMMPRRISR